MGSLSLLSLFSVGASPPQLSTSGIVGSICALTPRGINRVNKRVVMVEFFMMMMMVVIRVRSLLDCCRVCLEYGYKR